MAKPPPLAGGFRDPSSASDLRRLDEFIADAEAVAPSDIQDEVMTYRRSVQKYLHAQADGNQDRDAQRAQAEAGQAVNDYVDAHCF
jgi:hypothetical protein